MIQKIKNNAFIRNSAILFLGSMVANILNYVFHLITGRMVSVEVYGEVESLIALMNIISVPAATISMLATKYAAGFRADDDKNGTYYFIRFLNRKITVYLLPLFFIAILLTPLIIKFLNIGSGWPLVIVWISMFLAFYVSINVGILNGWQKFNVSSWSNNFGTLAKLICSVSLILIGFSLNGIMAGFVFGNIISYIASVYALKFIFKEKNKIRNDVEKTDFKSVRKAVSLFFLGNLAINIFGNIDIVIAKHKLDPFLAGQYGALSIVSKIIFFATGVIATVLFAMSSENNHKNKDSMRIFKLALLSITGFSFISAVLYFIFPNLILGFLFGNKYQSVEEYLGWFAILVFIFSLLNLILQYALSTKKTKLVHIFIAISIIMIISVLFVGKTISAILITVAIFQLLAVLIGLFFIFREKLSYNQFDNI